MKFVIDVDDTICTHPIMDIFDYSNAEPISENINKVNALYDAGHTVWFFTARGTETGIDWRDVTEDQLDKWNVKYHKLLFGKPSADVYIDDKALNVNDWV